MSENIFVLLKVITWGYWKQYGQTGKSLGNLLKLFKNRHGRVT